MRYYGGKAGSGKQISSNIKQSVLLDFNEKPISHYVEPFCGAMNVFKHLTDFLSENSIKMHASDGSPDLIMLWEATKNQTLEDPGEMTMEKWSMLKYEEPSALRAYAGFGYSYMGVFFNGYLTKAFENPGFLYKDLMRMGKLFKDVNFRHCSYQNALDEIDDGERCVIYCDPPYQNSSYRYGSAFDFDSESFYDQCRQWKTEGHRVFVSELDYPGGTCIFEKINHITKTGKTYTDRMFLV